MQVSIEAAQAKMDSTSAELWEAIRGEVQGRKQEAPSFQHALDETVEMFTQAFCIGIEESIQTLGDAVDDRLVAIEERMQEMEERLV